jgi:hypothetical protein
VRWRIQRTNVHAGSVDLPRHAFEPQVLHAVLELDGAHVLHEAEVVVVDGDAQRFLVGGRAPAVRGGGAGFVRGASAGAARATTTANIKTPFFLFMANPS